MNNKLCVAIHITPNWDLTYYVLIQVLYYLCMLKLVLVL